MAISGLNKQEAITLLQRQGLSTAQQAQILSSAGLLQTTQILNASLVEEAVLNSKISGEKAEQILTELGLIEAKTGNLVVTKECTVAEVAQALATKGIVGADAEAILSQLGLATANTTTTVSFSGLTTAIKANTVAMAKWLVTNPVGWCILAVGAIYGLSKAYDALTVSEKEMAEAHEESVQKAKESISEYEELKQELESIQQTYDDNEQKLKDLYKLRENQTITQAEQDYLEELEGQNEKLRQQIEYKQTLADIEAKESEDNAVTALNEKTQDDSLTGRSTNGGATVEFDKITDAEKIKQNTATINALTADLTAYEKVIRGISLSQEEVGKYTQQLVGYQEKLNAVEGESDYANSHRNFYQGKIDEIQRLLNGTLTYEEYERTVSDVADSVQSLVTENDALLQKVEPLNEAIKSTSGENYELKKANDEIITNAKDAAIGFNEYTNSLNDTADALNKVQGSTLDDEITVFSTESFNKEIKSYEDNYKRLIQAQEEWNETQALSPSTFVELQESGLLEYLEYTSDGLKVNTDKLLENAESCKNKAVSDLQAAMTSDMLAIAIGNTSNISDTAQSVIEQLGNNAEIAGDKALNSVADWATLGETISGVLKKAGVEDINTDQWEQMSAVYDYYKNLADNISEIDITAPERKSGDSGTKSKTKETFDWIETTISRIQRTITNLGKTVSATYKQWSTRNNTLAQEMSAINQEIATQQKAYETYMNKANSVSLPEHYKELVRNGGLRIEDIADETVQENVKSYKEWYEKALECEDAITDLQDSLAELAQTKFDNISKQYDDRIAMIEHHTSMLEGYVNRAEVSGFWASEVYYQKMAEKELENINQLQGKYNDLTNTLNESIANGSIEQYSEQWYEMRIQIDDVESSIQEANTALAEFNQTLQQIHWDLFDRASDYKDLFIEESNFLAELISRRDLYNEVGSLTADGLAVQGLHAVNYNAYMEKSEAYAEEILKLNEEIANDPNDLELIDRRNELIGLQQEAIKNCMSEKDAIRDLAEETYGAMLDSLDELISKRKEALAEKDLFDYQNSIKDKTDTISSYRKQLQAYANDNSLEARATIQKLQLSLEKAESDLAETQYEQWLNDQNAMLDSLQNQTEQWVNTRLDNIDGLVSEAIQATNDNTSTISGIITETAETLGYTLSEYTNMLWSGDNDNTSLLLKAYEDVSLGVDVGVTRLETVLNSIDQKIQTMVEDLNAQATVESESISQPEITYNEINNYDTGDYEPQQTTTSSGITFSGGTFYEDSYKGGKTGNSKNQWTGHEVEVTHESGTGMVHIVDKTTGTVLGWVDKDQLRGYATGTTNAKKGFNLVSEKGDELIRDKDGNIILAKGEQIFPFKGGETVFNAAKTAELLSGNLIPLSAEQLWGNIVKTPKLPEMVGRNTGSNIQQDINVHFELPNVTDANSLITELQQSKRFEKIIQSMTADQMLGKGSLGKFTY